MGMSALLILTSCVPVILGGQKMMLGPLELELEMDGC